MGFCPRAGAAELLALLADCASVAGDRLGLGSLDHADQLARAVRLDKREHWEPTPETSLGRVSKNRILEAVREGVSKEPANNLVKLKKLAIAEAVAQRLKGTGWLPPVLRLPPLE